MNMANDFVKENKTLLAFLALLWTAGLLLITYKPEGGALPPVLTNTYLIFGLAGMTAMIFIMIGGFLLYRWNLNGRKNTTTLMWGVSFLVFSISFIGTMLNAIGVQWADDSNPAVFFFFRHWMILAAAGMIYGISGILYTKEKWRLISVTAAALFSYAWFTYGLLVVGDIEMTMYGFLYIVFIPVCATIAYCFYKYGTRTGFGSLKIIAIGFAMMGMSYMAWAPWHKVNTYIMWVILLVLSVVLILVGFVALGYQKQIIVKKGKRLSSEA